VREVDVAGTTGVGGSAGTAAGAVVGSGAGGGNTRGNIVGAIGGAVVGGLAGAAIEANATKQKGMEYVVETENGNLMTIVQGTDTVFSEGQKVLVLYGAPSRLIADPRAKR
jgi:outer membrane lipoprotein SlyB